MIHKEKLGCSYLRMVNHFIFCDITGVCYMNFKETQIPEDTILFSANSSIYFYLENKLIEVLNDTSLKEVFNYSPSSYIEPIENYFLVSNRISRKEKEIKIIDREGRTIWFDKTNCVYKVIENLLFLFQDSIISLIEVKTGCSLWSYSLPEGYKIVGDFYLFKNVLFVNKKKERSKPIMVALDIQTGEKLWESEVSLLYYKQKDNFLYGFAANTFGDNTFSKVNIENGEVSEKKIENYKKDVASHLANIQDNKLYFAAFNMGEIGIIDLLSEKIIKEIPLNLKQGVTIGAPIVTEDKLYILDREETLHIFEKEEGE